METHSESKNGTRILGPEWNPIFGFKTEPRFNRFLEPCFQNENEPQKWFARTRRGGFRETIIEDQKWTLYVRQANQPRRVLQIRVWQSLWLALLDCQAHSERACRAERQPFRARRQRRQARHATAKLSACANCTLRRARTQSSVNVPLLALTEQCARAAAYASLHAYDKLLLVKSEGIQLCGTVGDGSSLKRGTTLQLQNWTSKLKRGNQQLATNLSAPAG